MVVQHNLTAMNSNRMLNLTVKSQAGSTEKLSSGYRINRAADDAAGLSISEKMRKQIRGLTQASANAQDGISMVQTAEGALNEVQDMLQRMNELAVKAANGTLSSDDRGYIQNEVDQLMTEIDRVAHTTKFNETYLLNGTYEVEEGAGGFQGKLDETIVGTNTDLLTNHTLGTHTQAEVTAVAGATCVNGGNGSDKALTAANYAAGFLDLSNVTTKSQVESLYGSGVSATCMACNTFYSIKFVDDGADLGLNANGYKAVGNAQGGDTLWVDISACNNGKDVVNKVMTAYALYNGSTYSGGAASYNMGGTSRTDGAVLSSTGNTNWHHVGIGGNDQTGKLVLFDTDGGSGASAQAEGYMGSGGFANGYVGKSVEAKEVNEKLSLHVGADATSNNQIELELGNLSTFALGLKSYKYSWRTENVAETNLADVTTAEKALLCIDAVKVAIQSVSTQRSRFGAVQNRLEHTINNLDNVVENTTAAESAIRDTDMAKEMVSYSNNNILAQAGQAMLAQSNQANQGVLSLLG